MPIDTVDTDSRPAGGLEEYGYPVVDSAALEPVARRWPRRPRRGLHELPQQPPGTTLVFQSAGGGYDTPSTPGLRLDHQLVVDAVAVAVVSMRLTRRYVEADLSTADPSLRVHITACFHCVVTDAVSVLDAGYWEVDPELTKHLVTDRRLGLLAAAYEPRSDWADFHRQVLARIDAYHCYNRLGVPGLIAVLAEVHVAAQPLASGPHTQARSDGRKTIRQAGPTSGGAASRDGNPASVPDHYNWGDES